MKLYPDILDAEFWKGVRNHPAYAETIGRIKSVYDKLAAAPFPSLPFSARNRFYEDGDRKEFEDLYFARRTFLSAATIMALIYPEQDEYLRAAEDAIWMICDEYSWSLPAHCGGSYEDDTTSVDLFSTETGLTLAETAEFLKGRINEKVYRRARIEVKKRVLENYKNRRFWWEDKDNNWSAVCGGSIAMTMMYVDPDMLHKYLPMLMATVNCCLDSYTSDGVCLEGFDYWSYGFGYFCYFADLLYHFTDGKTDLFADERVRRMATFPEKNFMLGGTTTSFADCDMRARAPIQLMSLLATRYPDEVSLPTYDRLKILSGRWVEFSRYFVFLRPELEPTPVRPMTAYLPDAGQYITTRGGYSFAVKAGHNDEPHNHNDIGGFIIATESGQEICDIGAGRYTRQYFRAETRYTIFCNSSESHSVPIINGKLQREGKSYRGTLSLDGDVVTAHIGGAYEGDVGDFVRTFELSDDGVTLTDRSDDKVTSLTERFVSMIEPTLLDGRIVFDKVALVYDKESYAPRISTRVDPGHGATVRTVYCIDFDVDPKGGEFSVRFEVGD